MQSEVRDKYKLYKERWAKDKQAELDSEYAKLHEKLIKEQESSHGELSKHETIICEIK